MILLLDIIEHLIEPTNIISESKRVLKKNGILVITTPNLANIFNRFFLLLGWAFSNYHASRYTLGNPLLKINEPGKLWNENLHKSIFTAGELKELIEKIFEFRLLSVKGYSYSVSQATGSDSTYGKIRDVLNKLLPSSMREGILIIAQKK